LVDIPIEEMNAKPESIIELIMRDKIGFWHIGQSEYGG